MTCSFFPASEDESLCKTVHFRDMGYAAILSESLQGPQAAVGTTIETRHAGVQPGQPRNSWDRGTGGWNTPTVLLNVGRSELGTSTPENPTREVSEKAGEIAFQQYIRSDIIEA
jgi:hypothetical protein